ncbi:MAG: Anti-sigma-I factor RsgI [Firmicutes bacterium ADurb.Bin193]|nr:MAG: Anti-sigma-I factor RsgI [Firmicutes bacterium ADurb.Bin193]
MKGIIADIKGRNAVMITRDGEFVKLRNKNYSIGQTVSCAKTTFIKYGAMVASFVLCLLLGFSGISAYSTPVSYLSIDINPSFQLDINRFDMVIKIRPLNDDAKALLATGNIKSQNIEKCISSIIENAEAMGFLVPGENSVEINVASEDEKITSLVEKSVKPFAKQQIEVYVEQANNEDALQAKELGISVGRLKALREYSETNGGSIEENADKLEGISNGQIKREIKEKNKPDNSPKKDQPSNSNGVQKNKDDTKLDNKGESSKENSADKSKQKNALTQEQSSPPENGQNTEKVKEIKEEKTEEKAKDVNKSNKENENKNFAGQKSNLLPKEKGPKKNKSAD